MASTSQRQKGRDSFLSTLGVFIQPLDLAKSIPPVQVDFSRASVLTMIRVLPLLLREGGCLTRLSRTR